MVEQNKERHSHSIEYIPSYEQLNNIEIDKEMNCRILEQPSQIAKVADIRFNKLKKLMKRTYKRDENQYQSLQKQKESNSRFMKQSQKDNEEKILSNLSL